MPPHRLMFRQLRCLHISPLKNPQTQHTPTASIPLHYAFDSHRYARGIKSSVPAHSCTLHTAQPTQASPRAFAASGKPSPQHQHTCFPPVPAKPQPTNHPHPKHSGKPPAIMQNHHHQKTSRDETSPSPHLRPTSAAPTSPPNRHIATIAAARSPNAPHP